jgi:hypothetical protein
MKKLWHVLSMVLVVALILTLRGGAEQKEERKAGLFAPLAKDQIVALKEVNGFYQIIASEGNVTGQKVVEVGDNYLALEDQTGLTQTRIPVTSIRSVIVSKVPKP